MDIHNNPKVIRVIALIVFGPPAVGVALIILFSIAAVVLSIFA